MASPGEGWGEGGLWAGVCKSCARCLSLLDTHRACVSFNRLIPFFLHLLLLC
jgi:hypothetical protein